MEYNDVPEIICIIKALYQCTSTHGELTHPFEIKTGVHQDCILSLKYSTIDRLNNRHRLLALVQISPDHLTLFLLIIMTNNAEQL